MHTPDKSRLPEARLLLRFFDPYPWALPALVLLGVLASLAEAVGIGLFIPLIQGLESGPRDIGGNGWPSRQLEPLYRDWSHSQRMWILSSCILGAVILRTMLNYSHAVLFRWLDARIIHRLRSRLFGCLQTVPFPFFEQTSIGRLTNILVTETWRTSEALATLVHGMVACCTLGVYVTLLLVLSWKLTLVVAAAMTFTAAFVRWLTLQLEAMGQALSRANEYLQNCMIEGIEGREIIRLFCRESDEQQRFDEVSQSVSSTIFQMYRIGEAVGPTYEIFAGMLLVIILLTSLYGSMPVASVLVFVFVLYRLQPKIMDLHGTVTRLRALKASLREIDFLLRTADDMSDANAFQAPICGHVDVIRFENVSFTYDGSVRDAISDISLAIPAGETLALVGPSGAGKSTFIKLLLQLYQPTSGRISIDGRALEDLAPASWRSRIAVVSQSPYLFNRSVADNIGYGLATAAADDVIAAAKLAGAHDFICSLPDRYETRLGDRGVRLSGGQQQRIALARAILRDPEILILDEPSNALDSISEYEIQVALNTFGRARTVIVIAHRLSTVEHADRIVVINHGRIEEQGQLAELLDQDGLFAEMFQLQHQADVLR